MAKNVPVFKVSNGSDVRKLAGCISHSLKGDNNQEKADKVELVCCGAGSCNQAVKAITISSSHARLINKTLITETSFTDIDFDGEVRTGIRFTIYFKE